jgi:hypothetical protein
VIKATVARALRQDLVKTMTRFTVVALAVAIVAVIVLSVSLVWIFSTTHVEKLPDGSVIERGQVTLTGDDPVEVRYPVPFNKPPDFRMLKGYEGCIITEHTAEHFIIKKVTSEKTLKVPWEAKGFPAKAD